MTAALDEMLALLDGPAQETAPALDALEAAIVEAALLELRGGAQLPPDSAFWDLFVTRRLVDPGEVERHASALRRAGEAARARNLLRRAIQASPQDAPLVVEYAVNAAKNRDEDGLAWAVAMARANLPGTVEGRLGLARVLHAAGQAEEANRIETEVMEPVVADRGPLESGARCALADALLTRGSLSAAAYQIADAAPGPDGFARRQPALRKRVNAALQPLGLTLTAAARLFQVEGHRETLFLPEEPLTRSARLLAGKPCYADAAGVCFLVNTVAMGGSERNAVTMANALHRRGDQGPVSLMVAERSGDGHFGAALDEGVGTIRVHEGGPPTAEAAGADAAVAALLGAVPQRGLSDGILRLAAALRLRRPRVLHVFASDVRNIQAGIAGMLAGVPVIVLNPGGMAPDSRGFGAGYLVNLRWMRAVYRTLVATGRIRMLHCSIAALEDYRTWLSLSEAERHVQGVNYYGFDASAWTPHPERVAALRREYGLAQDTFVLGTAFRFEDVKRPLLWVRIAEGLLRRRPGTRFVMVGGGSLHAAVREAAAAGPLRDALILPGRRSDMPDWYGLMSAFLMTSKAEGFGNVLLEAQAAGVPVVAPLIGGMPETFVHGRSGFVVTEDVVDAYCDRLAWMADNPAWRAAAAEFGRRFVAEQFPAGRMISDCLAAHAGQVTVRSVGRA